MCMGEEQELSDEEITTRMKTAVRRALNTPPTPTKELIGKSERAIARRESRVRGSASIKAKNPSAWRGPL